MVKKNVNIALGLCFGGAMGTSFGAAMHHIGTGLVFGAAFGLLIGTVISNRKQRLN